MSIEAKLNDLFVRWKAIQLQKADALKLDNPGWFFPDGLVGDEAAWLSAPTRVLYILKESNIGKPPESFDFWFKRIAADVTNRHIIKRRIQLMQQEIAGSDDLSVIAYMNLNKSGGKSVTKFSKLRAYATHCAIASLIKEQIEILAPIVIVCGGCYGLVTDVLGKGTPYRLVNMWHPSYTRVSDSEYMEKFRTEWEKGK